MTLKQSISLFCTFLLLLIISGSNINADSVDNTLQNIFSNEEYNWILDHQDNVFTVGAYNDSGQIYYKVPGELGGYFYDFFELVSEQTGLEFDYAMDDWYQVIVENGNFDIDLLVGGNDNTNVLNNKFNSAPIFSSPYWVCSNENYQSLDDLKYKDIGFIAGSGAYSAFSKLYDIEIYPVFYRNDGELFDALNQKEIEGGMVLDSLKLNNYLYSYGVKRNFLVRDIQSEVVISSTDDNEMLIKVLDIFMESYTDELTVMKEDSITTYIRDHLFVNGEALEIPKSMQIIKVGFIENYLPYDYKVGNQMKGISAELIKTIGMVLELPIDYIPYKDMKTLKKDLQEGTIDIISSYGSYEGDVGMDFIVSTAYSTTHIAGIGHKSNPVMAHNLYDLNNSRIAMVMGSWQEELLIDNRIGYKPVYVKNVHEAMDKVNTNDADYTIETLWTLSYLMNEISYDNLRPSGEIEIYNDKHLLFNKNDVTLKTISDTIITMVNLKDYETKGLYVDYQIQSPYEFYELLTVTLFLLLCFIGIYIAFLINRLNVEKQKAESANSSKSEFLAKMSHEIRTPLTAIMGYINLLSRSEHITGKEKQQLKIAYNSSNILIHLVNDILDFSKIEAGKVSLVEQDFNLRLMINNAVNIIGVMAEEKQIDFVVKLHENLPRFIVGDERRLEQILINILSNSVKFTEDGLVELVITAEYIDDEVRLNFVIRDTGKGMKTETINMIFEAFEQEDNSIGRRYGGTGLGLYISKDFIERMHGEIIVQSDVGIGTEFSFYTMHELAPEVFERNELLVSHTIDKLEGMKVLLVEDNDINQMIIRDILVDMGLKVIITSNGAEALEVVNPGFDFVLMDIQMPVMNGMMAVKIMKHREELNTVPIIALTANVMPEQIESYYVEGFDAYCSKPIMLNELVQTLLQMYEKYHTKAAKEKMKD